MKIVISFDHYRALINAVDLLMGAYANDLEHDMRIEYLPKGESHHIAQSLPRLIRNVFEVKT